MGVNANEINNRNAVSKDIQYSHWGKRHEAITKELVNAGDIVGIQEIVETYHYSDICKNLNYGENNAENGWYKIIGNTNDFSRYPNTARPNQVYDVHDRSTATVPTHNAIMYTTKKFTLMDYGMYVYAAQSPDENEKRNFVWGILKNMKTNESTFFVSTHLTHKPATSKHNYRLEQLEELLSIANYKAKINPDYKAYNIKSIVITGDFNINYLVDSGTDPAGYQEKEKLSALLRNEGYIYEIPGYTFYGSSVQKYSALDYICVKSLDNRVIAKDMEISQHVITEYGEPNKVASDHFATRRELY